MYSEVFRLMLPPVKFNTALLFEVVASAACQPTPHSAPDAFKVPLPLKSKVAVVPSIAEFPIVKLVQFMVVLNVTIETPLPLNTGVSPSIQPPVTPAPPPVGSVFHRLFKTQS